MQKETKLTLTTILLKHTLKSVGKENVDRLTLSEHLGDELPGLESSVAEEILDLAMKVLPYVEVRIDVDTAFWKLEELEHEQQYNAAPGEPGSVW